MKFVSILAVFLCCGLNAQAADLLEKTREVVNTAGEIVEQTVSDTVDTVDKVATGRKDDPALLRSAIDTMAEDTLNKLFAQQPGAKQAYQEAYGYAVFDSRVSSFGITTGYGKGVAVRQDMASRSYMKMVSGGVNLGAGIQYYQVIFLFPTQAVYDHFVDVGWDAGTDATGAVGKDGESMGATLANGTNVYQLNDKGIMLKTSLTGTRYWKSDELNEGL